MNSPESFPPALNTVRWCPFQDLSSDAEAAVASAQCRVSLATLEVACTEDSIIRAMVELQHPASWRWAVFNCDETVLAEGCETTRSAAKKAAEQTMLRCRGENGGHEPPAAMQSAM